MWISDSHCQGVSWRTCVREEEEEESADDNEDVENDDWLQE
jgi:hypothetical protein